MGVSIEWTYDRSWAEGPAVAQWMHTVGETVLARAHPKTGYRSGRLHMSMGQAVAMEDGVWAVFFGSHVTEPWADPVAYAVHHWAPGMPGGTRATWEGTRPWARAMQELGIDYETPEGYEV